MQCPEHHRHGANRYGNRYIKEKIIVVHPCNSPFSRQCHPSQNVGTFRTERDHKITLDISRHFVNPL